MHAAHTVSDACPVSGCALLPTRVCVVRGYAPCAGTRRAQLRAVLNYAPCMVTRHARFAPCAGAGTRRACASGDTPCTACPSRRGEGQGYRVRSARPSPALSLQVLRVLQDLHERCPPGWNIFRVAAQDTSNRTHFPGPPVKMRVLLEVFGGLGTPRSRCFR